MSTLNGIQVQGLTTGYGDRVISRDVNTVIPGGKITAIVGPNACGKSTLLRSCARLQASLGGKVSLAGKDISSEPHKRLAKRLALLTQGGMVPDEFTVEDIVSSGRYPHQSFWRQWSAEDERMVNWAMDICRLHDLRHRQMATLSGGQRQRAWFAMTLVQATDTIFLDEPTSFLDLSAQIEMLDIVWDLNRNHGKTIVMVLHDLNLAARYADHIVAMHDGEIVSTGTPDQVLTTDLIQRIYQIDSTMFQDPITTMPIMVPTV